MKLKYISQVGELDCTVAVKKSVDAYFNVNQSHINASWKMVADKGNMITGIVDGKYVNRIEDYYRLAGYKVNHYYPYAAGGSIKPSAALRWMYNEMSQGHVVQIGWYPQEIGGMGHASLVTSITFRSDFSSFSLRLMDPALWASSLSSFDRIYNIFSIFR